MLTVILLPGPRLMCSGRYRMFNQEYPPEYAGR